MLGVVQCWEWCSVGNGVVLGVVHWLLTCYCINTCVLSLLVSVE